MKLGYIWFQLEDAAAKIEWVVVGFYNLALDLIEKVFHRPSRLDHGPMYVCVIFALFLWSLSLLIAGPIKYSVLDELSDETQDALALCIFAGSSMCLIGILSGTRFFARHTDPRRSYLWGVAGTPTTTAAVWIYFWAVVHGATSPLLSGMGSALSLLIPVGAFINAGLFLIERRRITRNIPKVLQQEREQRLGHDDADMA
jgi:hypothetical protein